MAYEHKRFAYLSGAVLLPNEFVVWESLSDARKDYFLALFVSLRHEIHNTLCINSLVRHLVQHMSIMLSDRISYRFLTL